MLFSALELCRVAQLMAPRWTLHWCARLQVF